MKVEFFEILTNGVIDCIDKDNRIVGFIIAAMDRGFSVNWPGSILATKGRLKIGCNTQGDGKQVWFQIREELIKKMPIEEFRWDKVSILRGSFYYDHTFIGSTK